MSYKGNKGIRLFDSNTYDTVEKEANEPHFYPEKLGFQTKSKGKLILHAGNREYYF